MLLRFVAAILLAQCISVAVFAQKKDSLAPKRPVSGYEAVVTAQTKISKGLFTVYRNDTKCYFEIADSIFGRDVLIVSRLAGTASEMRGEGSIRGFVGDQINENLIRFEKAENGKIFIRSVSYRERSADSSMPLYKAVMKNGILPITMIFEVKATRKDTATGLEYALIDMTDLLNSDNDMLFFGGSKSAFRLASYQSDKSFLLGVKSYPSNTEIRTLKTYTRAPAGNSLVNGALASSGGGNATVEINTSLVLLPKEPMRVRFADERMGYFTTTYTDFDRNSQRVTKRSIAQRWRLEPRPEDIERYKRGELVEPVKPIVIYVDPLTPEKWIPYLVQGINDWNAAFEKAGFKNAIIGRRAPTPEEDPEWSLEDARHSVLVYKPSDVPNASGPQISDPRSGEIIETHINWFHNVMKLVHDWYFVQAGAIDTGARSMEFSDELMGQLIRFVSSHEVGHTLGLLHNYGASSATPVEKLRDTAWLTKYGHTASIMDYARFNYVAQPEDHLQRTHIFPRIGDYDKWAIEWGYRYFPACTNAEEENVILRKMVTANAGNKRLWYGGETVSSDPRVQNEDLGDDAMKAGEYGIKNLKRMVPMLTKWFGKPGETYGDVKEMHNAILSQFSQYNTHVIRNLGGRYITLKTADQQGGVYSPVPASVQREALQFVNRNIFVAPRWLADLELLERTGTSAIGIINGLQEEVLSKLFSSIILTAMQETEALYTSTYTVNEYLRSIRQLVWRELYAGEAPDIYRRNLQLLYLDKMLVLAATGGTTPVRTTVSGPDVIAQARMQLRELLPVLQRAIPLSPNTTLKAHYTFAADRIKDGLK
ncbi:MAG: zinc-dependent metalloprotease [Chitinophagaceae bacterium]